MDPMNRRLRVKFSIEEIDVEGVPIEDPITLKFGDDVHPGELHDFFDRCSRSSTEIFRGFVTSKTLKFSTSPVNKISAIKVIRNLTGFGLFESKQIVEGCFPTCPPGVIGRVNTVADVDHVKKMFFREANAYVELCHIHNDINTPLLTVPKGTF